MKLPGCVLSHLISFECTKSMWDIDTATKDLGFSLLLKSFHFLASFTLLVIFHLNNNSRNSCGMTFCTIWTWMKLSILSPVLKSLLMYQVHVRHWLGRAMSDVVAASTPPRSSHLTTPRPSPASQWFWCPLPAKTLRCAPSSLVGIVGNRWWRSLPPGCGWAGLTLVQSPLDQIVNLEDIGR